MDAVRRSMPPEVKDIREPLGTATAILAKGGSLMFDTTPTFLKKEQRPGIGGWAERHAWVILLFSLVVGFALRGIGIGLDVFLIALIGDVASISGIVLFITGLVLRRKTRREAKL